MNIIIASIIPISWKCNNLCPSNATTKRACCFVCWFKVWVCKGLLCFSGEVLFWSWLIELESPGCFCEREWIGSRLRESLSFMGIVTLPSLQLQSFPSEMKSQFLVPLHGITAVQLPRPAGAFFLSFCSHQKQLQCLSCSQKFPFFLPCAVHWHVVGALCPVMLYILSYQGTVK